MSIFLEVNAILIPKLDRVLIRKEYIRSLSLMAIETNVFIKVTATESRNIKKYYVQ